jgi:hypothetical protein
MWGRGAPRFFEVNEHSFIFHEMPHLGKPESSLPLPITVTIHCGRMEGTRD